MTLYGPPLRQPVSPDTVLCAFDLHRVLFYRDWFGIIRYLFHMPRKSQALFVLSPLFWIHVIKIWRKTSVGDEIYERLAAIYPRLALFNDDFIALENLQKPDEKVLEIVRVLKGHGYVVYVLSNIGSRAFVDLAKKFPELIHLFDHVFLPQKSQNYDQKPALSFYQEFLELVDKKGDGDKSVLFIDDRKVNLDGAAKAGITGLYFTDADQLRSNLERLSLIIPVAHKA